MTTPPDPWSSDDPPVGGTATPDLAEDDEAIQADTGTRARYASEALTVPMRDVTRPLALSHAPAPRRPRGGGGHDQGRSELATLFLGIGIGVALTAIVAAFVLAHVEGTLTAAVTSTGPKTPHVLPTATVTRTPTATPAPADAASFVSVDSTTQGTWQGTYGGQGAIVAGDQQQLPAGIQVTPGGASDFTWVPSTSDPRAPQKLSNPADRIAACWYAFTSFTLDLSITDGQPHKVALYLLDWDSLNRSETITVSDPATGAALDTRLVTGFAGGVYLVWAVHGHVVLTITNNAGSINAVVSGIFFSAG